MPVIPVSKVVDPNKNTRKNGWLRRRRVTRGVADPKNIIFVLSLSN
jgi:small-conductance mechanosensitive channel